MHSTYQMINGVLRVLLNLRNSVAFNRCLFLAVIYLISFSPIDVSAQDNFPDSIQPFFKQQVKDSAFVVALNALAFSYIKSNPSIARELAAKAIERSRDLDFTRGYARALNITGSSYWVIGDYESALDYYQLSARESGAIKDTLALAAAYNNMGEVHKKIGNYQKSIEFLTISLQWSKKMNQPYAITLYNIGENYLLMNRISNAIDFFDQSLSQALLEKDTRTLAYVYQGLGLIKQKDHAFAWSLVQQQVKI